MEREDLVFMEIEEKRVRMKIQMLVCNLLTRNLLADMDCPRCAVCNMIDEKLERCSSRFG